MDLVSIIVPVYNASSYLDVCITSLVNQSYEQLELLLIDDGSHDGSGAICDKYAIKSHKVRVIHKSNGGVSSARNEGLSQAKGKWLTFVDADDWVEPDYISNLMNSVIGKEDLVVSGYLVHTLNGKHNIKYDDCYKEINQNVIEFLLREMRLNTFAKLINREIINHHSIRFNEEVQVGEDVLFWLECLAHLKGIRFLPSSKYHYINATQGLHTQKDTFKANVIFWNQFMVLLHTFIDEIAMRNQKLLMHRCFKFAKRIVFSIYAQENGYCHRERIHFLSEIPEEALAISFSIPANSLLFHERVGVFLLHAKLYYLFDLWACNYAFYSRKEKRVWDK